MRKLFIAMLFLSFMGCTKDSTQVNTPDNVFIRVESIDKSGNATYSPISVVKFK